MRPCLVLAALVSMTVAVFGQAIRGPIPPRPRPIFDGGGYYGGGEYIPLLTTPQVTLETFSPNPVGASNATTGLIAGATNGTLSEIVGSTNSVYTAPVWYQGGGAPLMTPDVSLTPETIGRDGHVIHRAMGAEERPREERTPREEARANWTSFGAHDHSVVLGNVAKGTKGDHVYTNDDITRENEKNGDVKYDHKTEKVQ
jgi:hypothetical protein